MVGKARLFVLLSLIVLAASFFAANFQYPNTYLEKLFFTCLTLAITYSLFEILLEDFGIKKSQRLKDKIFFPKSHFRFEPWRLFYCRNCHLDC